MASELAPTWVPKTGPKPTQNFINRLQISTSLPGAPRMAPKLEKHPIICQNLQKWYQHGRIMGPRFSQNPCLKRLQGEIFWELWSIFGILYCRYILLYIGHWVTMETQGLQLLWAEAQLSRFSSQSGILPASEQQHNACISNDVNQTVSQPEARPQCTHLHFFISLCSYVIGSSGRNHIRCGLQSNSSGSRLFSPCIGETSQNIDVSPGEFSYRINCLDVS